MIIQLVTKNNIISGTAQTILNKDTYSQWGSINGDIDNQKDLIQKLSGYATRPEIADLVSLNELSSSYYDKDEVDAKVSGAIYDDTTINQRVAEVEAGNTEIWSHIDSIEEKQETDPTWLNEKSNYYTKEEVISGYLNKDDFTTYKEQHQLYIEGELDEVYNIYDPRIKTMSAKINTKQDKISDIDTIRANASGALKEETDPVWNSEKSNYYNKQEVDDKISEVPVYDDSSIVSRIETLENREDLDTVYDDTQVKNDILELSGRLNNVSISGVVYESDLERVEQVTASALVDLDKKDEETQLVVAAALVDLDKKDEETQLVVAAALVDLDQVDETTQLVVAAALVDLDQVDETTQLVVAAALVDLDQVDETTQKVVSYALNDINNRLSGVASYDDTQIKNDINTLSGLISDKTSEYGYLQYIRGNNAYIKTDFYGTSSTKYYIKYSFPVKSTGWGQIYSVNLAGPAGNDGGMNVATSEEFNLGWRLDGEYNDTAYAYSLNKVYEVTLDKDTIELKEDGETVYTYDRTHDGYNGDLSIPLCLFRGYSNGGLDYYDPATDCNIYYLQAYDNGELTLELLPCRKSSTNELGFYDTISKNFYTAVENTFIAGPSDEHTYTDTQVKKYIDDLSGRLNNIELWTFELSDGTTITKNIVIG